MEDGYEGYEGYEATTFEEHGAESLYVNVGEYTRLPSDGGYTGLQGNNNNSNNESKSVISQSGYSELGSAATISVGEFSASVAPLDDGHQSVASSSVAPMDDGHQSVASWNEAYQSLLEQGDDSSAYWAKIAALSRDFVAASRHYAAIIISELNMPSRQRTIRESSEIGGVAGGKKFVAAGILFKFGADPVVGSGANERHLYGGATPDADAAAKALGAELKGCAAYSWTDIPGLCFPLIAVIDYCGYRCLAISLLPIDKSTLRYGSDSGGRIAKCPDADINALMKKAGESINLAPHFVGSSKSLIYGPGDIECHRGKDGRLYVLDFGRVFPPEAPGANSAPGDVFFKLLRPELCRLNKVPLCSDAFTGFCRFDSRAEVGADASLSNPIPIQ